MSSLCARLQQGASIGLASALAVSCSAGHAGCGGRPTQSAAATAQAVPAHAEGEPALLAEIDDLRLACRLDESTRRLACGGAEEPLGLRLMNDEAARLEALPTLVELLGDKDEKRRAVVTELLQLGYSTKLGDALRVGDIDKGVAKTLLDALRTLPMNEARNITAVAVHAAMLSGQSGELHAVLADRAELKGPAYVRIMVHGRLEALPALEQVAAGGDPMLAASALEAARNMRDWTAEEQDVLCPWALEYFELPPWPRAARAAQALANCRGRHVDALLDRAHALHAEGKLTRLGLEVFKDICLQEENDALRCDRTLDFLAQLLEARASSPQHLRSGALAMMNAQAKALEESKTLRHQLALRIARKYRADPDKDVAREAQRLLARVEPRKAARRDARKRL